MSDYEDLIEGYVMGNQSLTNSELLNIIKKDKYIKKCNADDEDIKENIRVCQVMYNV